MRLALWLGHHEDTTQLRSMLEPSPHEVLERPDLRPGGIQPCFDLAVMDLRSHEYWAKLIHACREAEAPRFLPVLLLVHPSDLFPASRHLGCTADELVLTPIRRLELRIRIESLLRGRAMSLELERLHAARTEQALAEVRALRDLEQLRTQFISSVSHELRTPLTTIMGFAELLTDGLAGPLAPEAKDFVQEIRRAGERITHLVDELLDDARVQAGTFQIHPEPIAPVARIQALAGSLDPQLLAKGLKLDLDLSPACPNITADPRRVDQVLLNLLSNAIRHSPPGGRISVKARPCVPGLRVEVTDQGPGIAPQDQNLLFQRYRQIGGRSTGGTGLGLAIARAIVQAHGGEIGVSSAPGHGATFWFTLPGEAHEVQAA
ncbi:MAG: HAMP domain-containing sensor histidine kinase [Candidatus Sericytochromatia bacterium]|nr:HAMP domain-containing sensor histidine kinase [Candidatus Sericytochromatia bacterium]